MSVEKLNASFKKLHGSVVYERLKDARVTIFGLGGLGSNVAMLLTRAGVGHLSLFDYDVVEYGNLNRQFYFIHQVGLKKTQALKVNLLEINPGLIIEGADLRLTAKNIHGHIPISGVVVEAFDLAETKAMLINACLMEEAITIVSASGMGGYGESNRIITKKIDEKFYLVGDDQPIPTEGCQLMGQRVMIAASHQANQVVNLLMGNKDL